MVPEIKLVWGACKKKNALYAGLLTSIVIFFKTYLLCISTGEMFHRTELILEKEQIEDSFGD